MTTTLLNSGIYQRPVVMRTDVYESISNFILSILRENEEVDLHNLLDQITKSDSIRRDIDLSWCFLQVKRDLELKGIIQVSFRKGPVRIQTISLVRKKRLTTRLPEAARKSNSKTRQS